MYSPKYGPTEMRRTFKTPEGVYKLKVEKRHGQVPYSIERQSTRLSVGELKEGAEEGWYVLLNLGEAIHICLLDSIDRVSWVVVLCTMLCLFSLSVIRRCRIIPEMHLMLV